MAHSIGKAIVELRRAKGWTQAELAKKLGVSDKAVSKWEVGGGYPEITQFPALAEIFGVTVDYIMTGKPMGPETVIMSQLEHCAKTDDPMLARKLDLSATDEFGNTLIDYVIKYESVNVFSELCDRTDFEFDYEKYDINELYKRAFITNKTNILEKYGFKKHKYVCDKKAFPRLRKNAWFCVTDELLDVIALDNRINGETISYLFSSSYECQDFNYIVWVGTVSHFLHRCYLHGRAELVDRILSEFERNNSYAYKNIDVGRPDRIVKSECGTIARLGDRLKYRGLCFVKGNVEHWFCTVLRKTVDLAVQRDDAYYIKKFNSINEDIRCFDEEFYLHLEKKGLL